MNHRKAPATKLFITLQKKRMKKNPTKKTATHRLLLICYIFLNHNVMNGCMFYTTNIMWNNFFVAFLSRYNNNNKPVNHCRKYTTEKCKNQYKNSEMGKTRPTGFTSFHKLIFPFGILFKFSYFAWTIFLKASVLWNTRVGLKIRSFYLTTMVG